MSNEVAIVPGCGTCNASRGDAVAMYVRDPELYVRVVEGENCKCERGEHRRMFGPARAERARASTFEEVAA